jgi:hypothetical protein
VASLHAPKGPSDFFLSVRTPINNRVAPPPAQRRPRAIRQVAPRRSCPPASRGPNVRPPANVADLWIEMRRLNEKFEQVLRFLMLGKFLKPIFLGSTNLPDPNQGVQFE